MTETEAETGHNDRQIRESRLQAAAGTGWEQESRQRRRWSQGACHGPPPGPGTQHTQDTGTHQQPDNMEPRILLLLLTVVATRGEDTCSRDDVACGDEDLGQRLARIERLSSVNLNRAYEELKVVAVAEPEQPRVLFLMARLQRDLYLKLHVKMR